ELPRGHPDRVGLGHVERAVAVSTRGADAPDGAHQVELAVDVDVDDEELADAWGPKGRVQEWEPIEIIRRRSGERPAGLALHHLDLGHRGGARAAGGGQDGESTGTVDVRESQPSGTVGFGHRLRRRESARAVTR